MEAFGLVLAEAMLAAVPVIGTEVGGIPFVLGYGEAGRIIPPFRPDRIAAEALALHGDPAERRRLGEAGLARARAEFTAVRYASQIEQLYRELARRR
jgi:glycosyltransferase involved in cell wall biosynthesis